MERKQAIGIGCGAGDGDLQPVLEAALKSGTKLVLDADSLRSADIVLKRTDASGRGDVNNANDSTVESAEVK